MLGNEGLTKELYEIPFVELIDLNLLSYEKGFLLKKKSTSQRQPVEKLIKLTTKVNTSLKAGNLFPLLIQHGCLFNSFSKTY